MASASSFRPLSGRLLRTNSISGNCLQQSVSGSAAYFSTTSPLCRRKRKTNKDNNPSRGVSSIYRSGPREPLSMSSIPLPRPREDFRPTVKVDPNHGLWGFFPASGKLLWTPEETEQHGRPWTVEELRRKSWEDLHALWWVCCKERNRLATARVELNRSKLGFGARELEMRDDTVKKTMRGIKHALTERYYTWEDAVDVARSDPEINLEAEEGEAYTPSEYEDEYEAREGWEDAAVEAAQYTDDATKKDIKPNKELA